MTGVLRPLGAVGMRSDDFTPDVIVDRSVCGSGSLDETLYLWHRLGSSLNFGWTIRRFELVLCVDGEKHRTVRVGLNILHSTTMNVRSRKSDVPDSCVESAERRG